MTRPPLRPVEPTTWATLTGRLVAGTDLSTVDAAWAIDHIMAGEVSPVQLAAFAIALRAKGETATEIIALADRMLGHAPPVPVLGPTVDIVGTGGDQAGTVNISTMASVVAAAAGAPVAKFGNRAASSKSGAADVLEELGVAIDLDSPGVVRCLSELGIGFSFAPAFYPGLRHIAGTRRELGLPTTFNLLGPLANPARPRAGLVGCAFADKVGLMAEAFALRGARVLVVRGDDGLDELTTTNTSRVWVVDGGTVRTTTFDPAAVGIPRAEPQWLRGGDARENAAIAHRMLVGDRGPVRDAVLLNAAAALAAANGFSASLERDIAAGLERAAEAVDSGAAANLLRRWAELSQSVRGQAA